MHVRTLPSLALLCLLTACAPKNNDDVSTTNKKTDAKKQSTQASTEGTQEAQNTTASSKLSHTKAASVASWQLSGAMAARSKHKAWSAAVNWAQQGANNYQIRLSGPIGSGTVLINKHGGVVTYRDGAKTASSSSAEDLLLHQTGIRLPVSSLYYWVRGLPAPGGASVQKDANNHAAQIRQNGYTVDYSRYNGDLPTLIRLQGNGVVIKLAVKQWNV